MTEKLSRHEAEDYWRAVHDQTRDPLAAVCFPGKSHTLNACFDLIQTWVVLKGVSVGVESPQGVRALEIGCGQGRWLRRLAALGATVEGVDISPRAVQACRARGLVAHEASADAIPSGDETFDLVYSVTVLLHLPADEQAAAAREMVRVCRPGGRILLLEPTAPDASRHVWSRPVDDWISLFPGCRILYVENAYRMPLLRRFWSSVANRLPAMLVAPLETAAALISVPLEFVLMRLGGTVPGGAGLQHLIVLRKNEE